MGGGRWLYIPYNNEYRGTSIDCIPSEGHTRGYFCNLSHTKSSQHILNIDISISLKQAILCIKTNGRTGAVTVV